MALRFVSGAVGVILAACGELIVPFAHAASQLPQPTDPTAAVPRTEYRSGFANYRTFQDEKLAEWKKLNDEVERAGGHIGIIRAHPVPSPKSPSKPAPAPGGHGAGHH